MKLDGDEKEILESVKRGEWRAAKGAKRNLVRYSRYAKEMLRKDRRLNIRIPSRPGGDPEASARGGPSIPNPDLQPAAQVCLRRLREG
jgi:hypothetical protein